MESTSTAARVSAAHRTKDELLLRDVFHGWDENKDGSISKAEMSKVLQKVGLGKGDIDRLFKEVDANDDGQIAYNEFCDWLFADTNEAAELKKHIYRTTTPKDAMNEFFDYMQELMEVTRDRDGKETSSADGKAWGLADIFKQLDSNGNKKITMTEFVAGVQGLGHRIDEKMIQEIFKMVDCEIKNQKARKAPTMKNGHPDEEAWRAAFGDKKYEAAMAKHLGDADVYAANATPNLSGAAPVYYCGNDPKLQGKIVHASGVEYDEVLVGKDGKGKEVKTRRKVASGGSRDYEITMKEWQRAFEACVEANK